jgi:ribosomal protein S27E
MIGVRTVISVILHLKRRCPKCGQEQVVPTSQRKESVPCKACGALVPPPGR